MQYLASRMVSPPGVAHWELKGITPPMTNDDADMLLSPMFLEGPTLSYPDY